MDKHHSSKADPLLLLLLMTIPVLGFVASALCLLSGQNVLGFLIFLIMIVWPAWITLSTSYTIRGEHLLARCGPLRYKVKLTEIKGIEPKKTLRPGPALSWDKLKITYGTDNKVLFVSPADKYTFVYDLGTGGEEAFDRVTSDDDYEGPIY